MLDDVASVLDLHCLPMTFYRFPGKNGLKEFAPIDQTRAPHEGANAQL